MGGGAGGSILDVEVIEGGGGRGFYVDVEQWRHQDIVFYTRKGMQRPQVKLGRQEEVPHGVGC